MAHRGFNRGLSQQHGRQKAPAEKTNDLYNTGMPGDNPFQTMYQATIGSRAQTAKNAQRPHHGSQTPQVKNSHKMNSQGDRWGSQSMSKMNLTAKREQHRRFGEYHGEDGGIEGQQPGQSIWQQSPCKLKKSLMQFGSAV